MLHAVPLIAAMPTRNPTWMAGTWVWLNPDEHFSESLCNADHNDFYGRDGTYEFLGDTGRWRIDGDRLIRRITSIDPGVSDAKIGDVTTLRFRRVGKRTLRIFGKNSGRMVRCAAR